MSSVFNVCYCNACKNSPGLHENCHCAYSESENDDISDAGNYRHVSLATVISKLFEHNILSCISPFWQQQTISLVSSRNTALACVFCYLIKQTVSYYLNKDTPVFSAFLNASKALDRTNRNLPFAKLIKRNVPMCMVKLLMSWYRQQTMQVNWGTNFSPRLL